MSYEDPKNTSDEAEQSAVFKAELVPDGTEGALCNCTLNTSTRSSRHHLLCDKCSRAGFYGGYY